MVNTPSSAAVRAPPGSSLVHVVRRQEERETAVSGFDDADGDEVGPLPSPRPKRPTLKVAKLPVFDVVASSKID